jgi:hypothetical protein
MTEDKRTNEIAVYLYIKEKEWIEGQAKNDNRSISDWARLQLVKKMPKEEVK